MTGPKMCEIHGAPASDDCDEGCEWETLPVEEPAHLPPTQAEVDAYAGWVRYHSRKGVTPLELVVRAVRMAEKRGQGGGP